MSVIKSDPEIMSGTPCFAGTRVPVSSLFDYLREGYTIDEFLAQFPTVEKVQVVQLLDEFKQLVPRYANKVA